MTPSPPHGLAKNTGYAPYVLFALALVYAISPIDVIPDVVPMAGWVDDVLVVMAAGLNLLEKGIGLRSHALTSMLRLFKWIVIILGVIAVALIGLLGTAIVKLFHG